MFKPLVRFGSPHCKYHFRPPLNTKAPILRNATPGSGEQNRDAWDMLSQKSWFVLSPRVRIWILAHRCSNRRGLVSPRHGQPDSNRVPNMQLAECRCTGNAQLSESSGYTLGSILHHRMKMSCYNALCNIYSPLSMTSRDFRSGAGM